MKLSEELEFRGFKAESTIKDSKSLDTRENKQFYWGADPSADSLTIGNLAALLMCACFVKHGYKPYLLVGGATGQIGDPKENGERELKPLDEIEHNKKCIKSQIERVMQNYLQQAGGRYQPLTMVDNFDWFKDMNYLDFLRTVGKAFSMTQLLDRKFIQNRIGEGGSGISYAEFSYTLIQGYDFYHLYKEHGVALQLCGADQFGNCSSGIHLIKRLENAEADAWSTPLVIDPVSGRKFGKSEGNAVWLASEGENSTTIFDFYQFWLNQPDDSVEYLMKFYTVYSPEEINEILEEHQKAPEKRVAQKALAKSVTEIVHGVDKAAAAIKATEAIFGGSYENVDEFSGIFLKANYQGDLLSNMVELGLAKSKGEARKLIEAGAVSYNGEKIGVDFVPEKSGIIKKGKNKIGVISL
ncbi:tyrosine--tRNA ligase [Candidatus Saccharibacteria bacterium]|nr:tyrosine--tRNA ligase [Candidatus Saccharibacteria bacterium]